MLKELIRAIYEIVKAIKGESDEETKELTYADLAKAWVKEGPAPVGLLATDGIGTIFFKDYSANMDLKDVIPSTGSGQFLYDESYLEATDLQYAPTGIRVNPEDDGNDGIIIDYFGYTELTIDVEGKTYYYYGDLG